MKKLYMKKLGIIMLMMVGLGVSQVTQAQSVSVPYEKSSGSGWEVLLFDSKKIGDWNVAGSGLTVGASNDAGNSVNRNSQHWAFSPVIDLKAVSNFLVFADQRVGSTGSTFSVLVGPANAGKDRSQYVTIENWTGTESEQLDHKIDLSPWNSEEQIRIAFLRENEAGASWNISGLKVLGSDVAEVNNFRVTAITDDAISLNWTNESAQPDLQYLLVGSYDGDVSWSPERGSSYSIGSTVAPGVSVLYNGSDAGFVESALGEFVSRYYKLWVFSSAYEYSMEGSTAAATTIGESTIFYEDFEDLVCSTADWAQNGLWADDINNWTVSGNSSADSWLPNGGQSSYRGDKSAYIVEIHSGTTPGYRGNYGGTYTPGLSASIPIPSEYKSAELSFYWKAGGQQGYDYGRVYVNNVPVTTELYGQTYWKQEVVDLSDYIGQTITLKFEWRNTDAYNGVNLPSFAVDEVLITGKSVAKPELFSATVVNSSLVALDWEKNQEGNRVLVAYSSSGLFGSLNDGTAFEVGAQIPGGGEVIFKGDANGFNHSVASGNKAYYRIWSLSDGDANTYSTALTASTVLPASLPFIDGFEDGFVWNVLPSVNNSWYRGRANPKNGSFSAYVSGNGGFTTDYNGAWTDKPAILELPINLAGFSTVGVSFDWMLDGDINNTWGYVQMESGSNVVSLSNPSKLADKRTWQSIDSWIINNSSVFSSGSVLRFYMNINGGQTDIGFVLDNVRINGVLNPVTSAQAANYGGLKNYISWENAVDDASLEVVVLAFTSTPSGNKSLVSGETYSVGDLVDGGRVVYVGGGAEFVHEPILGGEEYVYQVYQKNGLTYSDGKTTTAITTPENVVFYEDFETNSVWNITGGTGNTWESGYPSNNGNGTRVAFVTTDSPDPGYAGHKHSGSFVVSMVKTFTFPRLQSDIELSFDYRVGTGFSGNGGNRKYDDALVTLSGDVVHSTGKLGNSDWQTYTSPLTLTGTGETATITMTVALHVNTELENQLGFLIDNISVTGAYDRNSVVYGSQGAESKNLPSLLTEENDGLEPFRFNIKDVGGDGQPTYVHQLEVVAGQDNTMSDWKLVLGGANLYKVAADNSLEYLASGIVQSQSLLFEQEDLFVVSEAGAADFVIKPWLKETLNSSLDNEILSFEILSTGIVASKGSSFKNVASSAKSDKYVLRIDATELRFAQEPSVSTNKNTALPRQPILIATDANGNIDSDFIGSVTVVSSPNGVNGLLSVNATDGIASFEGLKFAESGKYTLTFSSSSLSELTSAEIEVSDFDGMELSGTSYIGALRFAGIDSYTGRGEDGYELLTDQVAYLTTGVSYDMQVLFSVAQADGSLSLKAQIDYDGNGFVDLVSFGSHSNVSNKVEKRTVTIPTGVSGRYRLRLVLADAGMTKGEVEDYTVVISEGQWTGLAPQWDIRDNWTSGRIPLATDDVIVPSKPSIGVFYPVITDTRAVNNVTIESDARLTLKPGAKVTIHGDLVIEKPGGLILESKVGPNGLASLITEGSVSGEANIQLTLPREEWFYISHPIESARTRIYDVFMPGSTSANFRDFSHIAFHRNNKWYRVTGENVSLWNLEGVSVKYTLLNEKKPTHTLNYTGRLNNDLIARDFPSGGFYLFGNPYASSIDWEAEEGWSRTDIDGTIWYRTRVNDEMAFVTYNRFAAENANVAVYPDGMSSADQSQLALIPPMQSVWIKASRATTFSVSPEVREHGEQGAMLKSTKRTENAEVIRIVAENKYSRDGAVVYFWSNSIDELDRGDSEKLFNDSELVPEVYTRLDKMALSINGFGDLNEQVKSIPVSVRNRVAGDVTLSFDLSHFYGEHAVYFEDKTTGAFLNVARNSTYEYSVTQTGEDHDRFVLHLYKVTTDLEEVRADNDEITAGDAISIKSVAGKVLVSVGMDLVQQTPGHIEVYSIDGRKISEVPARSSRTLVILPNDRGVYIIRAQFGQLVKSERVVNAVK